MGSDEFLKARLGSPENEWAIGRVLNTSVRVHVLLMLLLWCRGCSRPDGATSVILRLCRTPCNLICFYCIHVHIPKLGLYLDTVALAPASPRDCLPLRLSLDRRLGRRAGLCTCYMRRSSQVVFQDIRRADSRTSAGLIPGHPQG